MNKYTENQIIADSIKGCESNDEIETFLSDVFFYGDYLAHQTDLKIETDGVRIWDNLTKEQVERLYGLVLRGLGRENK